MMACRRSISDVKLAKMRRRNSVGRDARVVAGLGQVGIVDRGGAEVFSEHIFLDISST